MKLRRIALLALTCAAAVPATAQADEAMTSVLRPTLVNSDGGVTVWRIPTNGNDRLVVRYGTATPFTTAYPLDPKTRIDLGASPSGGARVVFTKNCSTRSHTCEVRTVQLGKNGHEGIKLSGKLQTRIPYRGGGNPAIAIDGRRIAWTLRDHGCDVPYTRVLGGHSKRLDRGNCALIEQLDLEGSRIAVLAHTKPDTRESEARLLHTYGGKSRRYQRESQGEESNYIGQVGLDAPYLYTARGGIRQANVFTRFNLITGGRAEARAFTSLAGGFGVARGRITYLETTVPNEDCRTETGIACQMVDGGDPFTQTRLLTPKLDFDIAPAPLFIDQIAKGVGRLARKRVNRTTDLGTVPVPGVQIELVRIDGLTTQSATLHPTNAFGTTGADGRYDIAIDGTPRPRMTYSATTRTPSGVEARPPTATYVLTYVRMTATAVRLPDGRLRVTGTITPALPGRKVRLDRREERVCNAQQVFNARPTPSTVDTPTGCSDRWTQDPLATANVSADGASYSIDASTGAGTFRIALDFAGGADVYAGETAAFTG